MKTFLLPQKIKLSAGVVNEAALFEKKELQIGLAEQNLVRVSTGAQLVLDFGKELCGGIRILSSAAKDVPVRIRFGESLSECCAELGGEKNATNDHSLRDFTVALQDFSDMRFGQTGFRFVRLDFGGEATIKSILAESCILRKPAQYRYEGEDALLKRIYETAKRTVDLCAAGDYVWDGIKRDRLVWVGDMHPEMLALTTLYGRLPSIERSLDFIRKQTPPPLWMNNIPMYSMWWIVIVADYMEYTGAEDFAREQLDYLEQLVLQMSDCVLEDGTLNYPFFFVDWPTHGQPDEPHGVRAINVIAVQKAMTLLRHFGRETATAEDLLARLLKVEIAPRQSKQVIALKFFALGLNDADKERLLEGGAHGLSTFMSYYILKAVASFDKCAAIRMMKEYYGAMLSKGATSFWEDFDLDWMENSSRIDTLPREGEKDIHGDFGAFCYKGFRHSLCHGWSAGILRFMQEEL